MLGLFNSSHLPSVVTKVTLPGSCLLGCLKSFCPVVGHYGVVNESHSKHFLIFFLYIWNTKHSNFQPRSVFPTKGNSASQEMWRCLKTCLIVTTVVGDATGFHGVELGSLPNIHNRGLIYLASNGNPAIFKKAQGDGRKACCSDQEFISLLMALSRVSPNIHSLGVQCKWYILLIVWLLSTSLQMSLSPLWK